MSNKKENEELQSRREFLEGVDFVWLAPNENLEEKKKRDYDHVLVVSFDDNNPIWKLAIINKDLCNKEPKSWVNQLVNQLSEKYNINHQQRTEKLICLTPIKKNF